MAFGARFLGGLPCYRAWGRLSINSVYITNGSSVESKESPKTSSKLSKCSSGNTVDDKAKNEDTIPNVEDKNEPSNEEALDQAKSSAANFPLQESVKEGQAQNPGRAPHRDSNYGQSFVSRMFGSKEKEKTVFEHSSENDSAKL
ncbi:hypothetical protein V2J09_006625 [Rumex salicifolius]